MKNIVLTGFMGTGKTTIGTLLAKKTGRCFIDTDEEIVKREKGSIQDIFSEDGERYFRETESSVIAEVSLRSCCVIATGGGAVLRKENINNLRKNGIIINLKANVDTIMERTEKNNERPLLAKANEEHIKKMMAEREEFYADNDFEIVIENQTPLTICAKIIDLAKKFN